MLRRAINFEKINNSANAVFIAIGIFIYPLGLWGTVIPSNILHEHNLDSLFVFSMIIAWMISAAISIVNLFRIKEMRKKAIFWIGYVLNFLYFIFPIAYFIIIMVYDITA